MIELLGFLLPPFIDLINRKIEDSDVKFWISIAVCAVVGAFLRYFEVGFLNFDGFVQSFSLVFGFSQITYKGFGYKDSPIQDFIR